MATTEDGEESDHPESDQTAALTIGVELEFVVPCLQTSDHDPEPHDPRPVNFVPDCSTPLEMRHNVHQSVRETIVTTGQVAHVASSSYSHMDQLWETGWVVKDDLSINTTYSSGLDRRYSWVGVEVTSPIMRVGDEDDFAALQSVIEAIASGHRARVVESCGLHVHVGRGKHGFSPLTVKKLGTLLWQSEGRLEALYEPQRVNYFLAMRETLTIASRLAQDEDIPRYTTQGDISRDCKNSTLNSLLPVLISMRPEKASCILALWAAETIHEVVDMLVMPNPRFSARLVYNFDSLVRGGFGSRLIKRTIEFRQYQGTLDPTEVRMWAEVTSAVVDFARLSSLDTYIAAVLRLTGTSTEHTVWHFLEDMGCRQETIDWFMDRAARRLSSCPGPTIITREAD